MLDLLEESADMGSHGEFIIALVETLEPYNGSLRVNCDQSLAAELSTKEL